MTKITIRPFVPTDAPAFHDLNMQWLTAYFHVEPKDTVTLFDPQGTILDLGGQIFVADRNGQTVGCVALLPMLGHGYEVAKMAVDTNAQGHGIGRRLMTAAISWARGQGATRLYLESNTRLTPALRLYESAGFRHLAEAERPVSPYARADVFMELWLTEEAAQK